MIARLSSRRQLVIPKSIASAMRLKPGDILNVVREKNTIVLIPVDLVERRGPGTRSSGSVAKSR